MDMMVIRPGTTDRDTLKEVRDYRDLDIRRGDRVLDLGGCIGAFGRVAADAGAFVYAVEPEPSNAQLYVKNVPEAHLRRCAVGGRRRLESLWLGSTNSHSIVERRGRQEDELPVRVDTLDGLLAWSKATIVKADIEGSEYEVDWTFTPAVRELAMELHYTPKKAWREEAKRVVARIEEQGFQAIRAPKDTGTNWHSVGVWRRSA